VLSLLALALLGQTSAVKLCDPAVSSNCVTTTDGGNGKRLLDVNVMLGGGSSSGGGGDGGYSTTYVVGSVSVTDGAGPLTVDGTVSVTDGSGPLTVDGTVAATQSGAWSVSLAAALPAGTNNIGDVDVLSLPALPAGTNNIGDVDVLTLPSVTIGTLPDEGQQTMASSISVAIASNQSAVPASQSGTWTVQPGNTANTTPWLTTDTPRVVASANNTGTCTSVTASTTVLASNASRRAYGFKAHNNNTALVHCKLGATATTSNTSFNKGDAWSQDTGAVYTGVVDCIAASGTQTVCAYEFN
jgi:hypothetical protein